MHLHASPACTTEPGEEILIQLKSMIFFFLQAYNFSSFPLGFILNLGSDVL